MSQRDIDRHAIIKKYIDKLLTRSHAATLLHLTPRHVTRLKHAVLAHGAKGLVHKQRGQPSHARLEETERQTIITLLKEKYPDFTPTFAAEKLREHHRIDHDPKTIRALQIAEGLWKPRRSKTKEEHRAWRPRRPAFGEMLQFDGSYHHWFEGRGGIDETCLLASIDDATGRITKAVFAAHEGVFPVFAFWKSYIEKQGKPQAMYLDRFSTYKMNSAVAFDNPDLKTQFARVMQELGIQLIFALSPQAKGRVERLFGTLQDRLVKELRLNAIMTIEDANLFLENTFLPAFNSKFSVEPISPANLHHALTVKERLALPSVFSRQEQRTVQNDFTFPFKNQWYQLTDHQPLTVCKKDVVTSGEHLDRTIHVRLRGKELVFTLLPERPKKVSAPFALAKRSTAHTPTANHPWRQTIRANAIKAHLSKRDILTSLER